MPKTRYLIALTTILLTGGSILAACGRTSSAEPSPTPVAKDTESAESDEGRTLVYCMLNSGTEGLYPYKESGNLGKAIVSEAIIDGPVDNRSFDYQPVILQRLPSLAEGDARLVSVEVSSGDRVVDARGAPVALEAGMRVRPSGCQAEDCAIEYDGESPLQMDQLVTRFELLPGLLWSDGEPLTASDSVYSYNLQSHPDTPAKWDLIDIERTASYQALDELTTEWRGLPGYLDGTYFTNFFTPAPEHVWGQLSPVELLTAEISNEKPLGWGPYVIEEWDPEEGVTLTRNKNYFRRDEGLPHFDRLILQYVEGDLNVNIARLQSGECDVIDQAAIASELGGDTLEQLSQLSNQGQLKTAFVTSTWFNHLDFGIQPASYDDGWQPGDRPDFFRDVRVRRAFALCMDRRGMLEAGGVLGQSIVPETYLSPQHPLYNPNTPHYDFDPAAGAALLEEARWVMGEDGVRVYTGEDPRIPPGTRLSVSYYAVTNSIQEVNQVMADSLLGCGIEIKTNYWGPGLFAGGPEGPVFGRNFDLVQFRWGTGATPPCDLWLSENIPGEDTEVFPHGWEGQNNTGFSSPEYDQACLSALQSLPGQPGYAENHLRAQEIFAEQLPVIILYFNLNAVTTRPDFCGTILDPTETVGTWNIEEFNYGPDC